MTEGHVTEDIHPHPAPLPGTRSRFGKDKSGHVPEDYLHFGEFQAFEVFFFQDLPGFGLVLFYGTV
jgi:hypothetical protein